MIVYRDMTPEEKRAAADEKRAVARIDDLAKRKSSQSQPAARKSTRRTGKPKRRA